MAQGNLKSQGGSYMKIRWNLVVMTALYGTGLLALLTYLLVG